MNFLFAFLHSAKAFRLLSLDQLGERHKNVFVDSSLKLKKVNAENISNFYVVVHGKKIFFYSKGSYLGFAYDVDNVKLKLTPVPLGKVESFTQEIEEDTIKPKFTEPRRVKVMSWDEITKRPNGTSKIPNKKEVIDMEKQRIRKTIHTLPNQEIPKVREYSEPVNYFPHEPQVVQRAQTPPTNFSMPQVIDERVEMPVLRKKLPIVAPKENSEEFKKMVKNLYDQMKEKREIEIESDSELENKNGLDISIQVVDPITKSFTLKNGNNLCITYFQKAFLLTECSNNKRQLFRLTKVEEVAGKFTRPDLKKPDDEIFDESSSDEKKAAKPKEEPKVEMKIEMKEESPKKFNRRVAEIKKLPKEPKIKPVEKVVQKIEPVEESEPEEETPPKEEEAPEEFKFVAPPTKMKVKSLEFRLPPNFEKHCQAVFGRNGGRKELLPPGCEKILKFSRVTVVPQVRQVEDTRPQMNKKVGLLDMLKDEIGA